MNTSPRRTVVASVEAEYRRSRHLGDQALAQLPDAALTARGGTGDNSVATLVWHVAGNLASRFTDFLTSDGEKPWRRRDEEFLPRDVPRDELLAFWEKGWSILGEALAQLHDEHLPRTVTIRGQELTVLEALHRSLAHTSYHVGQIVYLAKAQLGAAWRHLSIPPGKSEEYRRNPTLERPPEIRERRGG